VRVVVDRAATRQPVHTVYGGAHLFRADSAAKLGALALRALDEYAPTPAALAQALGLDPGLTRIIYPRVRAKLEREPVEDFRIDFEDGYGYRPDAEEDATARRAAAEVARGFAAGTLPPFLGIRIKPLSRELQARGARTLELFMSGLLDLTSGKVPPRFVVTLPKVVVAEQVAALAQLLQAIETQHGLPEGVLRLEIMVETPQAVIGVDGRSPLPALVAAAGGRCVAAHFGVYDYTAALNITAAHQRMRHPACDLARGVMQLALAGTGVWLSDGATTVLPVGPHRPTAGGKLTRRQRVENRASVLRAWRLHFDDVRHSLANAYYQGWDLHPAQLVTRYAALYSFFVEGLEAASVRLQAFVVKAGQATLVGDVFDDAATGQGLLNFFLRGLNCGAITEAEALATGLTPDELRTPSLPAVLERRRRSP
jgi:citrate lyase beta subunit